MVDVILLSGAVCGHFLQLNGDLATSWWKTQAKFEHTLVFTSGSTNRQPCLSRTTTRERSASNDTRRSDVLPADNRPGFSFGSSSRCSCFLYRITWPANVRLDERTAERNGATPSRYVDLTLLGWRVSIGSFAFAHLTRGSEKKVRIVTEIFFGSWTLANIWE